MEICVLFWCILHYFIGPEPISTWSQRRDPTWLPWDVTPKHLETIPLSFLRYPLVLADALLSIYLRYWVKIKYCWCQRGLLTYRISYNLIVFRSHGTKLDLGFYFLVINFASLSASVIVHRWSFNYTDYPFVFNTNHFSKELLVSWGTPSLPCESTCVDPVKVWDAFNNCTFVFRRSLKFWQDAFNLERDHEPCGFFVFYGF